jgi:hypothetical protein
MRWAEISDCSDYDTDFDSSPEQPASYSDVVHRGSPTRDIPDLAGPSTLPDTRVVEEQPAETAPMEVDARPATKR